MLPIRVFISSVQSEFAEERAALRDYIHDDPLIRRFFDVFLFEDVPASDQRPDRLYLDEVERCDVYLGLFGLDYGNEDHEGVSPTEREFDRFSFEVRCAHFHETEVAKPIPSYQVYKGTAFDLIDVA